MRIPTHEEVALKDKNTWNPLDVFVYNEEPAGVEPEWQFRDRLTNLVAYVEAVARAPHFDNILTRADELTSTDRPNVYGSALDDYTCIAKIWTAMLKKAGVVHWSTPEILPELASLMMVAVKISRLSSNPRHQDSQIDGAGYLRMMQLIQEQRAQRWGDNG